MYQTRGTGEGDGRRTRDEDREQGMEQGWEDKVCGARKEKFKRKKREKKIVVYDETVNEKCEERKTRERDGNRRRKK